MVDLESRHVVRTLERLRSRIGERFPESGLFDVAGAVTEEARKTARRAEAIARPHLWARLLIGLILGAAVAFGLSLWVQSGGIEWLRGLPERSLPAANLNSLSAAAGLEAAVNLAVLGALAIWFLINSEARAKRRSALRALHGLRSLAHVVDMHQLTKDPTVILSPGPGTTHSPERSMNRFQLTRYLEYCLEMLALIGKLAALYAARSQDPEVIKAVNDIETLCADLGRKIWQKITILSALEDQPA